jgi:signal transduction histidine kinase
MRVNSKKRVLSASFALAITLLSLLGLRLSSSPQPDANIMSAQWRLTDENATGDKKWQTGAYAGVGFTEQQLLFEIALAENLRNHYLVVSPAYMDKVDVHFYDAQGLHLENVIKGDKTLNLALVHSLDIGHLTFSIPTTAANVHLAISSTESLQANLSVLHKDQLILRNHFGLIFNSTILLVIASAALASFFAWWWSKQLLYGVFAVHQSMLFILLLLFSYFIPSVSPTLVQANGLLMGAFNIAATSTGTAFHWQLLKQLIRGKWLNTAFILTILVSIYNLSMYFWGNPQQALVNSTYTLVVATMAFIISMPFTSPINHRQGLIHRKIVRVHALLMFFVVVAAISRLGFGNGSLLPLTYLFAMVTTLLFGYMMLIHMAVKRRQRAHALKKTFFLAAANNQLNQHLDEQTALLTMLSHEIKTPLTTIRVLAFRSPLQDQITYQISSIEKVLDMTAMMDIVMSKFDGVATFDVAELVREQWQLLNQISDQNTTIHFNVEGNSNVTGSRLALGLVIKNLMENARKYGATNVVNMRFQRGEEDATLTIENKCKGLTELDIPLLTKKYYRAANVSGLRGTGLGLWISQFLCHTNNNSFEISLNGDVFVAKVGLKL